LSSFQAKKCWHYLETIDHKKAEAMTDITKRVANLSPEKLELLMRRLQAQRGDATPKITPHQLSEVPLSFAQQRLWFIDQLEPSSVAYSIPAVLHLTGSLDIPALERSLNEISRRHEVLRTTFQMLNQRPIQVVAPHCDQPLRLIDLSGSVDLQSELQQMINQPFDLAQAPVWRVILLRSNETTHKLFLNIHHIIFDDWSLGLFLQELAALYAAFTHHQPSPLAELPIQYADFTVWQRDRLQGAGLENLLNYWKGQLADAPTLIELLLDRPRTLSSTHRSERQPIQLSRSTCETLKKLSRQEDATLFMTLFTAFATLLHRYTDQDEIVIGSPIANRNQVETENLIGFFVNTLALRANLADDPTFRSLLNQVRKTALDAYAHQDLPFEKLVEELQPERHPGCNPLVQVLFVLQTAPKSQIQLPNLDLQCEGLDSGFAKFDLLLELQETPDGIAGWFEYKSDLFEADTIARMVEHFQTLLQSIATNPDQSLSVLPLLTSAERQKLLTEWSNAPVDRVSHPLIHQVFEQQATQTPDAIALVFQDQQITYRQLNQRANQFAHYLQVSGVQPGDLVGICLERSIAMIVGLLGILKAGGAYVPLDPSYPPARLARMLQDTQISVLVTMQRTVALLPLHSAQCVLLDADWSQIETQPDTNPQIGLTSEALAYVMYTSGSTGQPKGVCVPHRGVVRLVKAVEYINLDATEILLQLAPLAFDASTFEIWGALLNGARLAIAANSTGAALSLEEIEQAIQQHGVTTLWLTSGLFNVIVDERIEALSPIRQLITGGDVLSVSHVQKALQALKDCRLINGYGPTENTTFTCCYSIPALSPIESNIPIGRPISHTQTYILDRHLQPVAIGVAGELYIGGDGLARGYLNQPEVTAQCFIPNPFDRSQQLYRTGDRVRYRADGNIEFLGRLDHQVKIRGFRIEPSEVEIVLGQHPSVKTTAVVVQGQTTKQLVAYVVPDDPTLTVADLYHFLRQKLPEYLIPTIAIVETLELTPNGKVDRRSLPSVFPTPKTATYAAPQDLLEVQLSKIWQQVLGVESIGVQDNFFELGGHSLLAVRLFAQIQAAFDQDLPLATLFQAPTIAQLAQVLRHEGWTEPWSSLVSIQPGGTRLPFFCVHGAGGNVLSFQALAQQLGTDQPFFGLQAEGLDGREISRTTVEAMAAHYLQEIRTLQPAGPYCLGGFSAGGLIAFEMAQQLRNQGEAVGLLALLDTQMTALPYHFNDRLALHTRKLTQQGLTYIASWIAEKIEAVRHQRQRAVRRKYFARSQKLPLSLRSRYVLEANQEIVKTYEPKPYPGRIDYFACTDWEWFYPIDPHSVWQELAGELQVHQVPGGHHDMIAELGIQALATQLTACLDPANRLHP
jgi:aspartate racemase